MGSFTSVCAISKNYITYGDQVKVLFLGSNNEYGSKAPLFFPLTGKYNDYGYIENITEDFNYDIFKNCVNEYFLDVLPESYRQNAGINVLVDTTYADSCVGMSCLPKIFAYTKKDPVFKQSSYQPKKDKIVYELEKDNGTSISFVMIKENVFNTIVENGMSSISFLNENDEKIFMNSVISNNKDFYESFANTLINMYEKNESLKEQFNNAPENIKTLNELLMSMRTISHDNFKSKFFTYQPGKIDSLLTIDSFPHVNKDVSFVQYKLFYQVLFSNNVDCFVDIENNMFAIELFKSIKNKDVQKIVNILQTYIELYAYVNSLRMSNTNVVGEGVSVGYDQCPGIIEACNSLKLVDAQINNLFLDLEYDNLDNIDLSEFGLVKGYYCDEHNANINRQKLVFIKNNFLKYAEFLTKVLETK